MNSANAILRLIAEHDGLRGWYQLDRALSFAGVVGVHIPTELARLVAQGYIVGDGDPRLAATHYSLTDAGRVALERLRDEGDESMPG